MLVARKEGKLLCCKQIFDWIKANLAKILLKKHQEMSKKCIFAKVPGVNGLSILAEAIFLEVACMMAGIQHMS